MKPRRARDGGAGTPAHLQPPKWVSPGRQGLGTRLLEHMAPSHPVWTESSGGRPQGEDPVINPISRTCLAQTSRGKQVADEEGREARNAANVEPRGTWFRLNLCPLSRVVLSRKWY